MMTRMRTFAIKANQRGLAVIEYVIVLSVVAGIAFAVFGGANGGLAQDMQNRINRALANLRAIPG